MAELGYVPNDLAWRKVDGEYLTGLGIDTPEFAKDPYICYPVGSMSAFLLEKAKHQPTFSMHFEHKVTEIGQDDEKAWVAVSEGGVTTKRMEGDLIVGCDGGQSGVRKALLGREFPGFTWPMQLISNNVSVAGSRDLLSNYADVFADTLRF